MPKITFKFADNREPITVDANLGASILDVASDNQIKILHTCGGNCACSTCHCIIEQGTFPPASEEEEEMLEDLEDRRTATSRLACQCLIHGDTVVKVPKT